MFPLLAGTDCGIVAGGITLFTIFNFGGLGTHIRVDRVENLLVRTGKIGRAAAPRHGPDTGERASIADTGETTRGYGSCCAGFFLVVFVVGVFMMPSKESSSARLLRLFLFLLLFCVDAC